MKERLRLNVGGALALALLLSAAHLPLDEPLIDAVRRGDAAAVLLLIEQGADVNAAEGDGMTALHWAAERGHERVVEVLIATGATVDAETRVGRYTPLHLAGRGGHGRVVRRLLEAGSDPAATTTSMPSLARFARSRSRIWFTSPMPRPST